MAVFEPEVWKAVGSHCIPEAQRIKVKLLLDYASVWVHVSQFNTLILSHLAKNPVYEVFGSCIMFIKNKTDVFNKT